MPKRRFVVVHADLAVESAQVLQDLDRAVTSKKTQEININLLPCRLI
jgi:hypothetical protein